MDLLFLACWTVLFIVGIYVIWKYLVNRFLVYVLMLFNLFFLSSLFYLYPIVIEMSGRG